MEELPMYSQAFLDIDDRLDLSNNKFTYFPDEICKLHTLQVLNISSNQLTSLPSEISKLGRLQILDVSYNRLTSLPSEIGKLNNLEVLNISRNRLTSLPSVIGKLCSLKKLLISHNKFKYLPTEICNLSNLLEINAVGNYLTLLPNEICKLKKLRELYVSLNQLAYLPITLGKLKLKYFYCSHNPCIEFTINKLRKSYSLYEKFARERICRFMYEHKDKILSLSKRNYLYYVTDSIEYMPPTNNKMGIYGTKFEEIYEEFLQINRDVVK